jgi:molybdopterin synthase catalytic subunit
MRTAIVEHSLDPAALLAEVASTASGASTLFVGTVRRVNEGKSVSGIDYTAYGPMAEREMAAVAREAAAMAAQRYLIEEIKKRVPVWKREHYADGTREWVDHTASTHADAAGTP